MSHILLDRLVCTAPDGTPLFPALSDTVAHEVVGLVGRNGCGKSTLLRAIAGELDPSAGTVAVDGAVSFMFQARHPAGTSVGQALGVQDRLDTLARFEAGHPEEDDFETVDWTLPARLGKVLSDCGLAELDLVRPVESLSGGERNRLKIAAMLLDQPDVLLLDEPTNDLDSDGRAVIMDLLAAWEGPVLVASHDRRLLEQVDRIIELTPVSTLSVTGGWSDFVAVRDANRQRASQALAQARADAKAVRHAQQARIERQEQRNRQGRQTAARRDATKLETNAQKERAQGTSARNRAMGDDRSAEAADKVIQAQAVVERITPIQIDLPPCGLQPAHRVLDANGIVCTHEGRRLFGPLDIGIVGPERIYLGGPNGSGKSSLVRILSGRDEPASGTVKADYKRIAVLDQHLSLLSPGESVLGAMQRHSPELDRNAAHAALARFGFRADWASRSIAGMSGGEKVRLALACLFSGIEAPHLLILDEPTNHLDLPSIEMLEEALLAFDGAIVCTTHDEAFKARLNLARAIELG